MSDAKELKGGQGGGGRGERGGVGEGSNPSGGTFFFFEKRFMGL